MKSFLAGILDAGCKPGQGSPVHTLEMPKEVEGQAECQGARLGQRLKSRHEGSLVALEAHSSGHLCSGALAQGLGHTWTWFNPEAPATWACKMLDTRWVEFTSRFLQG